MGESSLQDDADASPPTNGRTFKESVTEKIVLPAEKLFDKKGSVNMRRDALICGYTSLIKRVDPIKIWLLILAGAAGYLHYYYLRETAGNMHQTYFSDVWLSKPLVCTVVYLGVIKVASLALQQASDQVMPGSFEIVAVHNMYQTAFNAYMFWQFFNTVYFSNMTWWGNTMESTQSHHYLSFLIWEHYSNKYVELLDTCFIIARKRWNQMSGLHVLMRVLLLWSWYFVCRYGCGGDAYFGAMMHSFTQIFTYSYYCLALFDIQHRFLRGIVLRLHMLQFIVGTIHALYILFAVDYNPWLAVWQLSVMVTFLVLFTDFHYEKQRPSVDRPKEARIVFSFDSSGWLYVYHFGVAKFIETYLRKDLDKPVAYSGSSGGALVGACLCTKIDVTTLFEWILGIRDRCAVRPRETARCVKIALEKFLPKELHPDVKTRLKVLCTRVSLRRPPFFMGEILQEFESRDHLYQALLASSNVPLLLGVLPRRVSHSQGYGYYYDGMFWSQTLGFVPWRGFTSDDEIIKMSTLSRIGRDFLVLPPVWAIFPPAESVLRGLYALGYAEAHKQFGHREEFMTPEPISEEMLAEIEHFRLALAAWWWRFLQISATLLVTGISFWIAYFS